MRKYEKVICNQCKKELRSEGKYLKEGCFPWITRLDISAARTVPGTDLICVRNAMTKWWRALPSLWRKMRRQNYARCLSAGNRRHDAAAI